MNPNALEATLLLAREKYPTVIRSPLPRVEDVSSLEQVTMVLPVVVEADDRLFPPGEKWTEKHPLFEKLLPEMRDRIRDRFGVSVPGVRVRANDSELFTSRYALLLHEVPLVSGTIYPDGLFSIEQTGLPGEYPNPWLKGFDFLNQLPDGEWLVGDDSKRKDQPERRLIDPYQYIVYHLEAALCSHLAPLFGLQEVADLLEDWQSAGDAAEQAQRQGMALQMRNDFNVIKEFTLLLQSLLQELVPVKDLGVILQVFQARQGQETDAVVEAVRRKLKSLLPGNASGACLAILSKSFEEDLQRWVVNRGGRTVLAIPPGRLRALLSAVRRVLDKEPSGDWAVVSRLTSLRPFVRRLLETQFPQLPVLAVEELSPEGLEQLETEIDVS